MISNAYANKILNLLCGVSDSLTLPTTLYLGLSGSAPNTSTGAIPTTNGEPTAASYARTAVGGSSSSPKSFGSASAGVIKNSIEIQFKTAREAWGKMNYFFLSDSATGAAIMWGEINNGNGVTISEETVPTFYENELKISLDMPLT